VSVCAAFLNPSEAAGRLGISVKALRLYERRGLLRPARTAAGWRLYGPDHMRRAADIAALRGLGFGLAQVARLLDADVEDRRAAFADHQAALEGRIRALAATADKVRALGADLDRTPSRGLDVAFDLPWPWGGERFELRGIGPLTHITGPLGSGKTRLAKLLADTLPDAGFLGLERSADGGAAARACLEADPALRMRVGRVTASLVEGGGSASDALVALLAGLEAETPAVLVVDMLEHGLDEATQKALIAHLRRRGPRARPLLFLTRSSAILDLGRVGEGETILLCPANHGVPFRVAPRAGGPFYEALASCLASPDVRARTEGVVAWRPQAA